MIRLQRWAMGCFAIACFFVLGGCSTDPGQSRASDLELPVQDRTHMTSPLDSYYVPYGYYDYVVYVYADDCLIEKGFDLEKATYDPTPSQTQTVSGVAIFNESVAGKFGYGSESATLSHVNWKGLEAVGIDGSDPAYSTAQETCRDKANEYFDISDELIQPIGATEFDQKTATAIHDLAGKWVACMAPIGVGDLPDSPTLMPSASVQEQIGTYDAEGIYVASAYELQIAVADAKCRESTGWAEAVYQALWDADLAYIEAHKQELGARKAEMTAIETKFNEYMAGRS